MSKSNIARKTLDGQKWHNNPRLITEKEFAFLKESLEELGDLSGVVHDLNTNQYVGGNQRSTVFEGAEVVLTEAYELPTRTGTVALGYIIYQGEKYQYRQVRWTLEQCRKANIVANSAGGKWDFEMLANEWDDLPLAEWGLNVPLMLDEEPEDLLSDAEPKPAVMKITFTAPEQLQKAEVDIQELLDRKFPGAYFSVSAGGI